MAGYGIEARNAMLDALAPRGLSLHDGDPGLTGSHEVAGCDRRVAGFTAAYRGSRATTDTAVFEVPAGATVRYFGIWSDTGAFLCGGPLSSEETYAAAGQYHLKAATLTIA